MLENYILTFLQHFQCHFGWNPVKCKNSSLMYLFYCINTCQVPQKMLEHLAYQPCDQTALDRASFMHGKIFTTLMHIDTSIRT